MDPARADDPASGLQIFACGLAAGMLAKLATHPLDVAKKRFQVAGLQRSVSYGQVRFGVDDFTLGAEYSIKLELGLAALHRCSSVYRPTLSSTLNLKCCACSA